MIRIGQKLKEQRMARGLSLEEVARDTKIRKEFLLAIEKGEYRKLPSSAYAYGFVRNYAGFLGLPKSESLAIFRREFDEKAVYRVLPEGLTQTADFPLNRMRIQQAVIFALLAFLAVIGYFGFHYRYAFINPPLSLMSPKEGEVLHAQEVTVTGKTDPNAAVMVNTMAVSVNEDGKFSKTIDLFEGKTKIVISATNRFGKKTTVDRSVEVNITPQ